MKSDKILEDSSGNVMVSGRIAPKNDEIEEELKVSEQVLAHQNLQQISKTVKFMPNSKANNLSKFL